LRTAWTCSGRTRRVVVSVLALTLSTAGVVLAHATLVASSPRKNENLASPPTVVRLEFSEAVTASSSRIALVASDSTRIALTPRAPGDGNPRVLEADVPTLSVVGAYVVEWRLIGADGHPVSGQYAFTIDSMPAPLMSPVDTAAALQLSGDSGSALLRADSWAGRGIRFMTLLALVTLVGSSLIALRLAPRAAATLATHGPIFIGDVEQRLTGLARPATSVLLLVLPVRLLMQAGSLAGSLGAVAVSDLNAILLHTWWGAGWMAQLAGTVIALVALGGARGARGAGPVSWRGVAVAGVMLAAGGSMMGHPAAVPGVPVVAMGLDAVHALAAGGWVGGLAGLALAVLPSAYALPDDVRIVSVRNALRLFSPIALTGAALLVLTGLAGAWWQLGGDPASVVTTAWGRVLLAKLGAALAVAALGAWHWKVVQPSIGSDRTLDRLRISVRGELLIMGIVLVLTAVLTGTATAGLPQ